MNENEAVVMLTVADKERMKTQIYEIRGIRVMMDADIASYFGVETKALNRAMKRNIKRFPEHFCFQLTKEECSRFQIGTLNGGRGSNIKYLPYVYSEQGVAMLTSTLHTDRAIEASILIMEAFVEMSHYLRQNAQLLPYQEIQRIENRQLKLEAKVDGIEEKMVTRDDLSTLMKLFEQGITSEEVLILDGQPFKADVAYQKIYGTAKKKITIVDDYLGVKTLQHLAAAKSTVSVTIISDNKGRHPLRLTEFNDFLTDYPGRSITFVQSMNRSHDRYSYLIREQGT